MRRVVGFGFVAGRDEAGSMENRRRVAEKTYRSEDRPLHVERIRRWWAALERATMVPVVGIVVVAVGVRGRAGRGSRGWS